MQLSAAWQSSAVEHELYLPPEPTGPSQVGMPLGCGKQCSLAVHTPPGLSGSQVPPPPELDELLDALVLEDELLAAPLLDDDDDDDAALLLDAAVLLELAPIDSPPAPPVPMVPELLELEEGVVVPVPPSPPLPLHVPPSPPVPYESSSSTEPVAQCTRKTVAAPTTNKGAYVFTTRNVTERLGETIEKSVRSLLGRPWPPL